MDLVEIIQRENKLVLETIVKDLGITEICIEAAQEDMRRINGALGKLRASEDYKGRREDELLIGAAGQMLLEGKIDRLVPVDDAETRDRAQSLMRVGRTEEANAMQNKRETMVLRNMVKNGGGNQLLVFGGLHGFPDNIKCTFPACEYTTVKTNAYHEHGPK